jgi:ABC-type nitrate/sulfonate/bicarbonate transport system substrate-binding protein
MSSPRTARLARLVVLSLLAVAPAARAADVAMMPEVKGDGGKVRLLFNPPGTNSFIPFAIKKFELDKKYGFELVPVPTATTQSGIAAIQSGGAEMGTFGWNDVARMMNAGVKVVGVGPFLRWGADFIMVRKDSPIQTLGDLKGKKIGTTTKTALNWIIMRMVGVKDYGLDIEKEGTVHEGAPPLLWGLLEQGQLDATHMFNSQEPAMVATGKFRPLAKISDLVHQYGLPDTPFLLYAADAAYAKAHPDNMRAYLAAYREAVQILATKDEPWIERGKEMTWTPEVALLFAKEARTDIWSKFEPDTEANIRNIFALLLKAAGAEALGTEIMPDGFMTLQYQ